MVILLAIGVNLPPVQTYLSQQAALILSEKLDTKVSVRHLRFHLFNAAHLEGLFIADQHNDTLFYAGDLQFRMTDWFFGTKTKTIHYIGLTDAKVYLHRFKNKDEWNYSFLENLFGGNASSNTKNTGPEIQLALEKIDANRAHFYWKDEWVGTDYEAGIGQMTLKAKDIDWRKRQIHLSSLTGDKLLFGILQYTGGRPPRKRVAHQAVSDTTAFNPGKWQISLDKLDISESRFYLEYPEESTPQGLFDEDHLNITGIQTSIKNIKIIGDTISGHVSSLSAKERCGLSVRNMRADISVSPVLSECRNLYLQTGNSTVTDYYAMHYNHFPDFLDYIDKVKMVGHLKNSEIGLQDIVYFAPELSRLKDLSVQVSGQGSGTVARLSGQNLSLNDGFSQLTGSLIINGLPDIEETFIDFRNVHLLSSGAAALFYAPELKTQNAVHLESLSSIDFSGNYTGYIRNFVAYGNIQTNLGNVEADLNMKLPENDKAAYSGHLRIQDFATGVLLNQQAIGKTSFSMDVSGKGFNPHTLSANVAGVISSINFNRYNYQNIKIDGTFNQQKFNGALSINDPNAVFDFDGNIDLSKESPSYHFTAIVNKLQLQPLNFSADTINLTAGLQLDMSGNNLDNLTGTANISHINLLKNGKLLDVQNLSLSSAISANGSHKIQISTNQAAATIDGHFYPSDLWTSTKLFLSYYLPEYMLPPDHFGRSRYFNFHIQAGDISDLLSLVNPGIQLKGSANISGNVNLESQSLSLNGAISKLSYGNIVAENTAISGIGDFSGLHLNLEAQNIHGDNEMLISDYDLTAHLFRDTAKFQIQTTSPSSLDKAVLNGQAIAHQDSIYLQLTPSMFNFNNKTWHIGSGNQLVFAQKFISIQNLKMQSGQQSIEINPADEHLKGNNALLRLKKIDLAPLNNFINLYGHRIDGQLNGTIYAHALLDTSRFDFDLSCSDVRFQQDTIGTVNLKGYYQTQQQKLTLTKGSGIQYQGASIGLSGSIDHHGKTPNLNGTILLEHAHLSWLSPVLEGYVSHLTGTANGLINFSGNALSPQTQGHITLQNAVLSPDITGVVYRIPEGEFRISNTHISLDTMQVYDLDGNYGNLSGTITHKGLRDFYFGLRLSSDRLKVLHQNQYQNNIFYGNVNAKVNTTVRGYWDNLTVRVIATPVSNSSLFITVDNSSDLGSYRYIRFKQKGQQSGINDIHYHNKYNFILDAVITPDLQTTLILDPESGDQIWSKGNGNIILEIPSEGDMKMNGSYVIQDGTYNFSFQHLQILNYKRQFEINPNSAIKWNGGLSNADLDVTAHTTVKARLYDLIADEVNRRSLSGSGADPEIRDAQIRQNINVLMNMKGSLEKPELNFKIQLAESHSIGTYAYQKLQRINTDEKQTLIQVSSLLLLGQFVPPEGINNSAISSGTINNMSELFSSAASSQITNFANKLLGMKDLSVGVKYKNYSLSDQSNTLTSLSYFNRNEAEVNLRKNFLNDRLVVEVGGIYDWGAVSSGGSNYSANLAGDFRIQYLLTPDGRVRFSIFRTSDYDPLYSLKAIGRQGVNLSYRKSFNTLSDFFSSRYRQPLANNSNRQKAVPKPTIQTPADPIRQKLILEAQKDSSATRQDSIKVLPNKQSAH